MYLLSSRDLLLLPLVLFAVSAHSFSCSVTDSSIDYDLSALSGLRVADKQSSTPPTTSEAKVMVELCKSGGIPKEDGVADEDQVSLLLFRLSPFASLWVWLMLSCSV